VTVAACTVTCDWASFSVAVAAVTASVAAVTSSGRTATDSGSKLFCAIGMSAPSPGPGSIRNGVRGSAASSGGMVGTNGTVVVDPGVVVVDEPVPRGRVVVVDSGVVVVDETAGSTVVEVGSPCAATRARPPPV
jgi:hypothetical protein